MPVYSFGWISFHTPHNWMVFPLCGLSCDVSVCSPDYVLWENFFPHSLHVNGFFPCVDSHVTYQTIQCALYFERISFHTLYMWMVSPLCGLSYGRLEYFFGKISSRTLYNWIFSFLCELCDFLQRLFKRVLQMFFSVWILCFTLQIA
jgi:hypothetical protein